MINLWEVFIMNPAGCLLLAAIVAAIIVIVAFDLDRR
jgi:hypothetical protein